MKGITAATPPAAAGAGTVTKPFGTKLVKLSLGAEMDRRRKITCRQQSPRADGGRPAHRGIMAVYRDADRART